MPIATRGTTMPALATITAHLSRRRVRVRVRVRAWAWVVSRLALGFGPAV